MKKIKFQTLLLLSIIAAISGCKQPQTKEAPVNNNAVALADATLKGDELIKTDFGDIQLNETYINPRIHKNTE